jgi:threonylcarbamoyladenosine tRNA methylthiotransferase MtaB
MTGFVASFGCRLNQAEGDAIAAMLPGHDVRVVNTCAVTAEAEAQARQALRRARRAAPGAEIVATGCAATIAPQAWAGLADRVVPNAAKLDPATWGTARPAPALPANRTRAVIEAQQGCDHACTFCVIPLGRGASRPVPAAAVIARVRAATEAGASEAVLSGVDLTSWREDQARLGDLVRAVLRAVPNLPRLRLSSIDVAEIDAELWRVIGDEPRLMPHLHLSLQAGDDLVLKRMKRRHTRAQAIAAAHRARALRPGIALAADLIAGFPTETDAAFANTLDLVAAAGLSFLHVFPYSPRPGTPAARMPQLPRGVVLERAARLREAGASAAAAFARAQIGRSARWLAERDGSGRTEHFLPLRLAHGTVPQGTLLDVRVTAAEGERLLGIAL